MKLREILFRMNRSDQVHIVDRYGGDMDTVADFMDRYTDNTLDKVVICISSEMTTKGKPIVKIKISN